MNAKLAETIAQSVVKQLPKLARWGIPGAIFGELLTTSVFMNNDNHGLI